MTLPDLTMIRGDTRSFPLTLYGDDGEPLSLENAEITFTAKRAFTDSVPLVTKTLDDGIELGEEEGEIIVTLQPEDTNDITYYTYQTIIPYVWDVQVIDADYEDAVQTRRRGVLRVFRDVTVPA